MSDAMGRIGPLRILDWDIENRPLAYLGDWTTAEITVIAAAWIPASLDSSSQSTEVVVEARALTHPCAKCEPRVSSLDKTAELLDWFEERYEAADMVTGHFIRGHDLPVVNGARLELGWEPLEPKLVQDTKTDLIKTRYLSLSQENLSAVLGLDKPKKHMDQAMWRRSNRLESQGVGEAIERAEADVRQHIQLRAALLAQGWLKPPSIWRGDGSMAPRYRA